MGWQRLLPWPLYGIPGMVRSRLWLKLCLLLVSITLLCSFLIASYTIPLSRDITYQMAETHATALLDHVCDLVDAKAEEIESYKNYALERHKRELKHITAVGGYIIKNQYAAAKRGALPEAEAKKRAIELIQSIRYGNQDYLLIADFNSVLIAHPDPNLHNADFSSVKDVYGNLIIPPMVAVARTKGEGFTSYWWKRLEMIAPTEKLTYSTLFAPWSWVYGTGVYIDDIVEEVKRRKRELVDELQVLMNAKKIEKSGYMYIFDANKNLVIHPDDRLKSRKQDGLLNPVTGNPIFEELMETAFKGGPMIYLWDRPEDPGHYVYEKISWVRHNEYFNWYIASSVYMDELYRESHFLSSRIVVITLVVIVFSILLGSYFLKKLLTPIETLSNAALKVQKGNLKIRTGISRHDEIGILAREFDGMVEKLDNHVDELDQKVKEKTRELADQFTQLEYANSQVMESIHYARTIQTAILPEPGKRPPEVSDHFVLWRPKDIIGGDIFWVDSDKNGFTLAVIDCTGHGVPGAIMTMIACMALNQVVQEAGGAGPGEILRKLNRIVQCSLGQHAEDAESDDGLDIGLCRVNTTSGKLFFAGANLGLFVLENGKVLHIKGDRQSIGYKSSDLNFEFNTHEIELWKKRFYLATDGLIGQIGGEKRIPFGRRRFVKFLTDHHQLSLADQKKKLKDVMKKYRGNEEQRDDITVIGFTC